MTTIAEKAVAFRHAFPQPVASSQGRGWRGAVVELFRVGDHERVAAHAEHLISMQLNDCACIEQRRDGRRSERAVKAGDVIVTPAGAPKYWRRRGTGLLLVVAMEPGFLDGLLAQAGGGRGAHAQLLDNFGTRDAVLESAAESLRRELVSDQLGGRMWAEAAIVQLALHLLRGYCATVHTARPVARMSPRKLQVARAYVEEHLGEDLSVERLARAVAMSAFHFAHAFRSATGEPPHRYVMQRRVERAKDLLQQTDLPLTEIAQRVGYSSPSHFSVAFRRLVQVPPSRFRKGG